MIRRTGIPRGARRGGLRGWLRGGLRGWFRGGLRTECLAGRTAGCRTGGRRTADRAAGRRAAGAAALALTGAFALGACSTGAAAESDVEVTGAYMPEPVMADMAGGFLVVTNHGEEDDTLTKVTSGIAASVEMHETDGGAMQRVDSLPVPAGGRLELERGGEHLMFHDLARKPTEGDTVKVTLHFAHHDPVTVSLPVKPANHDPATAPPTGPHSSGNHE